MFSPTLLCSLCPWWPVTPSAESSFPCPLSSVVNVITEVLCLKLLVTLHCPQDRV